MEMLQIAGKTFESRLFVGTGKFASSDLMEAAVLASQSRMVTVALKRVEIGRGEEDDIISRIVRHPEITLLPNTSGVRSAKEAILAAELAREALQTNWLKLEVHPDPRYLLPDPIETLRATEELVRRGFIVLPYVQADPVLCKHLEEAGADQDVSTIPRLFHMPDAPECAARVDFGGAARQWCERAVRAGRALGVLDREIPVSLHVELVWSIAVALDRWMASQTAGSVDGRGLSRILMTRVLGAPS